MIVGLVAIGDFDDHHCLSFPIIGKKHNLKNVC
jgi:hypothetical protein